MWAPFSVFIINITIRFSALFQPTTAVIGKNIVVALLYAFFAAPNIVVHVAAVYRSILP